METIYVSFGAIILYSLSSLALAKPFEDEKSYSDDNKLRCADSNGAIDYDRTNPFSDYSYKPRSRLEGVEKYPNRPFGIDKRRSDAEDLYKLPSSSTSLQKRQVGVVYKDEMPIGILQPYQRSYRFIPVKEESSFSFDSASQSQDVPYSIPGLSEIDKRDTNAMNLDLTGLEETYPSILTNFKIVNKLDKKRNYDALTDENVRDLKATIRRLRSSNPHNSEQIEEELKNILDDMGLIEDEESHGGEKRDVSEQIDDEADSLLEEEKADKGRNKRDEPCVNTDNTKALPDHSLATDEKKNEIKSDVLTQNTLNKRESEETHRKKRQKEKEASELVENLKDSGDLMLSGNKSPLASSETAEKAKRSPNEESEEYETRVERQIQNKINSLKEEVKREIAALKKRQSDDDEEDDMQRKKRQVFDTLVDEETNQLNPALNPENEQKPLIRRRRRKKREADISSLKRRSEIRDNQKESNRDENDEPGGELLGDFDEGSILKRDADQDYLVYDRNKRSGPSPSLDYDSYFYNNYFYDDNDRSKRRSGYYPDRYVPIRSGRWSRFRRRINEDQGMGNRPQQLSDMSDLDLFGALPKSYDGELSRYKRVKRK